MINVGMGQAERINLADGGDVGLPQGVLPWQA
jgi:hypothetical protein